jgi:tRNA threonylcarbamoyladenosine biosynthesis protein TsaB
LRKSASLSIHFQQFAYTGFMHFIVVDTADARGSVAIFRGREQLCADVHRSDEDYSSWLLPAVQRALSATSLSLDQLDGYAVCAGPGSFTGLRVGLTTVKAWAEVFAKPIVAVSRLEAITQIDPAFLENLVACYIDARREQVFVGLYQRSAVGFTLSGEEAVESLPNFIAQVVKASAGQPVRWLTPDAGLLQSLPEWEDLKANGHTLQPVEPPFAFVLGKLGFQKLQQGLVTDAAALDANYIRRSDAEVLWKANKSVLTS